jgi:hypothetical protein
MKYLHLVAAPGCWLLVSCSTGDTFDTQAIETRDASDPSVVYYSNRDVGVSARLSGTSTGGQVRTRDLWVFGDSGGREANGDAFVGTFGFPTNTAALVTPRAPGSSPPVSPMPSAVQRTAQGRPDAFVGFITGATASYPPCDGSIGEYRAKWPGAVVRLPDSDPRYETALVFYQNWCVDFTPLGYRAFDGGVAVVTWDANSPDARPTATILNDRLFAPGRFVSEWLPSGLERSNTYGQGAYFKPGSPNELITLQCGKASDCTAARWIYDPSKSVQMNLDSVRSRTSWAYRTEGATASHTDDVWRALPPVDATPDDDCTPTSDDACSSYPLAKAVSSASSDPLTQVWGAPSVAVQGSSLLIAYMPGPPAGGSFQLDHASVRVSLADGIFGAPVRANFPAGRCASGCYAPVFHPELNHGSWQYFSYFANDTLTLPNGDRYSSLRVGRSCAGEFNGGSCP